MEHLAKKLTDYIYEKKDNYRRISRNLSVRFSMLLELSVKYHMQYYNSAVSRYAA